jgi:hypothetical protein
MQTKLESDAAQFVAGRVGRLRPAASAGCDRLAGDFRHRAIEPQGRVGSGGFAGDELALRCMSSCLLGKSPMTKEHVPTGATPPTRSILMYTAGKLKPDSLKLRLKTPLSETNSLRTDIFTAEFLPEDRRGGGQLLRRSPLALAAKNFDEMLDASVA